MPLLGARTILLAAAALLAAALPAQGQAADYLYYSGTGGGGVASTRVAPSSDGFIGRVNQDGTGNDVTFIRTTIGGGNIAANASHLFWSQPSAYLGHAGIDGAGASTEWLDSTGNLTPAVAINRTHVYYAWGGSSNYIGRAALDGTGNDPTYITLPSGDEVWWLAANDSHVFWLSNRGMSIGRVGVDGGGLNPDFITGLTAGTSITVTDTHMYWIDDAGASSRIGRAALDGTAVNPSLITGLADGGRGIAVTGVRIFWGNAGPSLAPNSAERVSVLPTSSIGVANIDGTGVNESFLTQLPSNIYGVAVAAQSDAALAVTRTGNGTGTVTSTPPGIDCGASCTALFPLGSTVALGARAATGSVFTGWSGDCAGTSATCSLAITGPRTATATFYRSSDLRARVLPSRRSLVSGQSMRIGIRARNTGGTTATSVTSCLRLPSNLVVTRAPRALRSGRTVCFRVGDIRAGAQVTRTITVRAVATRRVVRTIGGSDRLAGGVRVNAAPVRVVVGPRAARARVTG